MWDEIFLSPRGFAPLTNFLDAFEDRRKWMIRVARPGWPIRHRVFARQACRTSVASVTSVFLSRVRNTQSRRRRARENGKCGWPSCSKGSPSWISMSLEDTRESFQTKQPREMHANARNLLAEAPNLVESDGEQRACVRLKIRFPRKNTGSQASRVISKAENNPRLNSYSFASLIWIL